LNITLPTSQIVQKYTLTTINRQSVFQEWLNVVGRFLRAIQLLFKLL